ncbi:hypothetical protein, partial [Desulfatiglans anilini]|uniref:hypothetical protein n=1 Tax=Desulfatiglans anilini TaxID=90728 RepID=UPI00048A2AE4
MSFPPAGVAQACPAQDQPLIAVLRIKIRLFLPNYLYYIECLFRSRNKWVRTTYAADSSGFHPEMVFLANLGV